MTTQPNTLHYPKHSAQALGQDYINHVMAMTSEDLRAKSDIAIQLARRDAEIRRLNESNTELLKALRNSIELVEREVSTADAIYLPSTCHKGIPGQEYVYSKIESAAVFTTEDEAYAGGNRALDILEQTGVYPNMCELF